VRQDDGLGVARMPFIETVGRAVDGVGIAIIAIGGGATLTIYGWRLLAHDPRDAAYRECRRGLGPAILLGLELLVAGDIIRTVAISPTFASVGVLAIIVLIRTFLSATLTVEIEGRWPWESAAARASDGMA
jgi:uncharacterized membrane protein